MLAKRKKQLSTLSENEKKLVSVMSLLGDETRYKMFLILSSDRELCVSEIASSLKISVPAVSQNFRIFELANLVRKERVGQRVCYKLNYDEKMIKEVRHFIKKIS